MIVSNNDFYVWLGVVILRSLEKGVSWKFWLDPRFPRNPKLKWILKWLPLDRGCFKFYFFTKGESLLIIPCHIYTFQFVILSFFVSSHICIAMHLILFKTSRVSILLIDNPSKKRWHGNFGSIIGFPVTLSKSEI